MQFLNLSTRPILITILAMFIWSYDALSQCGPDCTGTNTFVGNSAGNLNTTGSGNSFFGFESGFSNSSGSRNSFFGEFSGLRNTLGASNSFYGSSAGNQNTTGVNNTFFGTNSGIGNTIGNSNSFFGTNSGFNLTTGSNNIVIGRGAGPTTANNGVSNRLYIDVIPNNQLGNDEPLIYGEFDMRHIGPTAESFY